MKKRTKIFGVLLVAVSLALTILSGCGPSIFDPGSPESGSPDGSSSDGASHMEYADLKKEAQKHGYPFVLEEYELDLNGDQIDDQVKLLQEWYPIFDEQGTPSFERGLLHYATIQFTINQTVYSHTWEDPSYGSTMGVMEDVDGNRVFVVVLDAGGTGAGNVIVSPVVFDGEISFLPMPTLNDQTQWPYGGFEATATYSDGYRMEIAVPETGFCEQFDLPGNDAVDLSMYDESGMCTEDGLQGVVYGVSGVNIVADHSLELVQCISGKNAVSEQVGYLISEVSWQDGHYVVLKQYCSQLRQ